MTGFHEVKFPTNISQKAKTIAEYKGSVVSLNSGYEKRNQIWNNSKLKYEIELKNIGKAEANKIMAFFHARRGRTNSFRFKDWNDFEAKNEQIAIADGTKTQFQLIKNYGEANYNYQRKITKPVAGTLQLRQNGSAVSQLSYNVLWAEGVISFVTPPAVSAIITADFEFDVPVRFESDFLAIKTEEFGKSSIEKIILIEVK